MQESKVSPVSAEYTEALNQAAEYLNSIEEARSTVSICRHVLHSGKRCKAIARKESDFCFFHGRNRGKLRTFGSTKDPIFDYQPLEDRASINTMLNNVLCAFNNHFIEEKAARIYLYGIQLALNSLAGESELTFNTCEPDITFRDGAPMVSPREKKSPIPMPEDITEPDPRST